VAEHSTIKWDRGAAEREARSMFGNQALHRAAATMAGSHPRALDYIRQAPVIVLSTNAGKTGSAAITSARAFAGPPMRMLAERGAKLREVMSFYGCGYQLRQIVPGVLFPSRWPAIYRLGRLPPSTLAQVIPATRVQQDVWLRALTYWTDHCRDHVRDPWVQFEWAAVALRDVARGQERSVDSVADLLIEAGRREPRGDARFDPRWTFAQAVAAADRWHAALGRQLAEQRAAQGLGVAFSAPVDYAPMPNDPVHIAGFDFVPLRSCEDLWVEGAAMHHCVATYSEAVVVGRSRIFSIRKRPAPTPGVALPNLLRQVVIDRFRDLYPMTHPTRLSEMRATPEWQAADLLDQMAQVTVIAIPAGGA
jgi:hypothetical protein